MSRLLIVVLLIFSVWLGQYVTGFRTRAYPVLQENDQVQLGEESIIVSELIQRYQPQIFMRPGTISPPPNTMWYEVVETTQKLILIYHPSWDDEIHPNPWLNALYAFFRAARYGYPLQDVEYIQIDVAKSDGSIQRIRYETSPGKDYNIAYSEHWLVWIDRVGDSFSQQTTNTEGAPVLPEKRIPLSFEDDLRLKMGVVTWNHLLEHIDDTEEYSKPLDFPLRFLDNETYRKSKFARKSQGDWSTPDSVMAQILGTIFPIALLTIAAYVIHRKGSNDGN